MPAEVEGNMDEDDGLTEPPAGYGTPAQLAAREAEEARAGQRSAGKKRADAEGLIGMDHPYRPLFAEPRHDRCTELGANVFVVGRRRCLCGEVEAFAPEALSSVN